MTQTHNRIKETPKKAVAKSSAKSTVSGSKGWRLTKPGRTQTLLICLSLFLVAMGFNLYRIGDPSIWFDEALSVYRAQQSLPVLFRIVAVTQPNMALYYFVLHFWLSFMSLFGVHATEAVVRFPSALFAAIDSLIFYFLARRFFGPFIAILTSLMYLLNTLHLTYAQETRSYTLQLLLLGLSWYALCVLFSSDLSRERARRWWICFIVTSTLAIYTQLFTELVLVSQVLSIALLCSIPNAWRNRVRQQLRPLLISWACIAILSIPIFYASSLIGSKTGWLPIPKPGDIPLLFLTISAQSKILLALYGLTILLGLCIALLATFPLGKSLLKNVSLLPDDQAAEQRWLKRFLRFLPLAIVLVCWLLCPVVISYIVSQKSTHLFSARYLVVIVPAFILLVALGLSTLRWRIAQIVLSLCLLLLCLRYVPTYYNNAQVEDWRTGTQWLQQHYQSGDGLICYDNSQGCAVSIEYYMQTYPNGNAHFDADSPGYFLWVDYDTTNKLGNYGQALNIPAIQKYANQHSRLFFAIGRADPNDLHIQSVIHWLNTNYHPLDTEVTDTLTIYLYDTTIHLA
jgi:uncharacterized membrane protein